MEGTLFIIHVTEESRTVTAETRFITRDWNESIQKKAVKKSRVRDKLVVSLQGQTRRITRVCDKTTQVDPYVALVWLPSEFYYAVYGSEVMV